jgi:hypothetical protein
MRWYSVVVSISGCDPLDPGSNPGTAMIFFLYLQPVEALQKSVLHAGLEPATFGS